MSVDKQRKHQISEQVIGVWCLIIKAHAKDIFLLQNMINNYFVGVALVPAHPDLSNLPSIGTTSFTAG